MQTLKLKNVVLGEGKTKICVPIVGKSIEEVLESAKKIILVDCDLVELRIDHFVNVEQEDKLSELLVELRKILNDKPILSTFRTKSEGGVKELSDEKYFDINKFIVKNNLADAIDLEVMKDKDSIISIVELAKQHNVGVIMSNHDFFATPEKDEIKRRLRLMQEYGADVCKIAVMPNSVEDVLNLLTSTREISLELDRPVITMSMGKLGVISRLAGGVFGSTLSFGAVGEVSAPGQVEAGKLRSFIEVIE